MSEIAFHPFASIFPLIEGFAFRELVEDIRVHGLREAIILHDGQILDGRNRYLACRAAQVGTRFKTYDGKDALAFVVSANLHRRHLDASQRALIAAELSNPVGRGGGDTRRKAGRRDKGGRLINKPLQHPERDRINAGVFEPARRTSTLTFREAGELLNVSEPTVAQAKRVLTQGAPELIQAVREGRASVSSAQEISAFPKEQQRNILASGNSVAVIGRGILRERIADHRERRAEQCVSVVAVFDHLKVGDGRSLGNVRIGEIARLTESLRVVIDVLLAVGQHGRAGHGERVRDVVNETTLAGMIEKARDRNSAAG